jgi:hypothetical protein
MTSFELEIDEQSRIGSEFMARVANEIRRAASIEKATRKITQQAIADKIGTSRAVVNREMSGLENLTARRTAELLWALGWEAHFEARKIPASGNQFYANPPKPQQPEPAGHLEAHSEPIAIFSFRPPGPRTESEALIVPARAG